MFELSQYSEPIQAILKPHEGGFRLMPLAPREPLRGEGLERLSRASSEDLFAGRGVASQPFADCVRSALFLYLSALEDSHVISQSISSSTGSFLHGIMHRQEPDYSNSKYWFRRAGAHETFPQVREAALEALAGEENDAAAELRREIEANPQWDAFWFVDQCEEAARAPGSDLARSLQAIQRAEWQVLFDYCYRRAVEP